MSRTKGPATLALPPVHVAGPKPLHPGLVTRDEAIAARGGIAGRDAGPPGLGPQGYIVREPGGEVVSKFLHPSLTAMEREFETLPSEAMFLPTVRPSNPLTFSLGSYTVPKGMVLWLEDWAFSVLLPDPIDPHAYRFSEQGRFRGTCGFDVTVADRRGADISYQLEPVPIPTVREEFETVVYYSPAAAPGIAGVGGGPTTDRFNRAAAMSFASTAGIGSSLQPPRGRVPGPRNRSWVWPIGEGENVSVRCVIFRPFAVPINGIYAMIAGHVMHTQVATALQHRTRVR